MIKRFRHKGLESPVFDGEHKGHRCPTCQEAATDALATEDGPLPEAMSLPGYRLHQLKGNRKGSWSVWVSGHYRLIFEIEGEDATNGDFEDYH